MFSQTESTEIVVEIGVSLKEDVINEENTQRRLERDPQEVSFELDLRCLASDMSNLVNVPIYCNMDLQSSDAKVFRVHSSILSVRWSNLFRWHRFDTTANTVVKTNISSSLLEDILKYTYSCMLHLRFPAWANPPYMTELFQVIDRYGIHHFYTNFVEGASFQLRVSRKSGLTQWPCFRPHFVNDVHPQEYVATLGIQCHEYKFVLQIQVSNGNRVGAWLSYSLRSRADSWVYAQVNLEIVKMECTTREGPFVEFQHTRTTTVSGRRNL
ncbi:hypothetical protein AVEN_273016-1 [Araneus ventricosus]|uniref:BTB domain-containing protein n=1 Tax=Araneus ventricosus TaxID=182803 RepID=A0A4Y2EWF0_ARAVE|nr:hypothetical protein AVEN_273016-1 [Araneus ventricosus]